MAGLHRRILFASGALGILGLAVLFQVYVYTQYPTHRSVNRLLDFLSYLISFAALPVIRQFFTINETFWDQDHELQGLKAGVDVYRDKYGVPYIFGHNVNDVNYVQAFIEYTERPFQLEFLRRLATGQLAETLGEELLSADFISRLLVDREAVEKKLKELAPDALFHIHHLARAWNEAAAKLQARPIEFALLDWQPHTSWTPTEILQVSSTVSFFLNRGFTVDFCRALLKKELRSYWKAFDIRLSDPRIPFVNSEGFFPSLFDQRGVRVAYGSPGPPDDAWARRRPPASPADGGADAQSPSRAAAPAAKAERTAEADGRAEAPRSQTQSQAQQAKHPRGAAQAPRAKRDSGISLGKWGGSNGWAVAGKYSASGHPILAGDPHLEATAPGTSFWLPLFRAVGPSALLTTPPWVADGAKASASAPADSHAAPGDKAAAAQEQPSRLTGAGFVGFATVFIGHNGQTAWTQTVAHTDIEDLFLVKLDGSGEHYFYDGRWVPLRMRVEAIAVRGFEKPVNYLLRYTHHGPLISDAYEELQALLQPDEALAFASAAIRSPPAMGFGPTLNFGKDWRDLLSVSRANPQSEFVTVWATREGDIGASLSGGVPVRAKASDAEGDFRDGSSSAADWNGIITPESLPHVMNPKEGFVASANCQIAPDPDDLLGQVYVPGNRIRRIHERLRDLIRRKKKITVQDMMEMQLDVESINGREFRDYVLRKLLFAFGAPSPGAAPTGTAGTDEATEEAKEGELQEQTKREEAERGRSPPGSLEIEATRQACAKEGLTQSDGDLLADIFRDWDGRMNGDSTAATVYEVWIQWLLQELFKLHNFSDLALFVVAGGGLHSIWLPRTEMLNHWRGNLMRALETGDRVITDVTTPVALLCRGAASALRWLRERYGDARAWRWGSVRARFFTHILGEAVPLLRHSASIGPLSWGGNYGTVRAHHSEPHVLSHETPRESQYTKGLDTPAFRMVVDTGNFSNSFWAFAPGVSGWVGSRHYDDMAQTMEEGQGRWCDHFSFVSGILSRALPRVSRVAPATAIASGVSGCDFFSSEFMVPMLWTDEQIAAAAVTHARFLPAGAKGLEPSSARGARVNVEL
ncbi:penicillin amidase [Besnoitia besnoiti]|uniref:Penicillin amidase n=1 Tax=Besnoitia besnoiti TaxID=94643 RepID=A0A2A9MMS6_BESBE|nr:penicillin amidase [Besnoitia besnoiti]PFH36910.1 penicillin amidase [Besnoitia besnoiti]